MNSPTRTEDTDCCPWGMEWWRLYLLRKDGWVEIRKFHLQIIGKGMISLFWLNYGRGHSIPWLVLDCSIVAHAGGIKMSNGVESVLYLPLLSLTFWLFWQWTWGSYGNRKGQMLCTHKNHFPWSFHYSPPPSTRPWPILINVWSPVKDGNWILPRPQRRMSVLRKTKKGVVWGFL